MKRLMLAFVTLAIGVCTPVAVLGVASAASPVQVFPSGCGANICKESAGKTNPIFGPSGVMTEVIHLLAIFVAVVSTITVIVAGIMMSTAAGDAAKVANARRALLYAAMGLLIAAVAQGIVAFVLNNVAP